jgi:hypothetical protein
VNILELVKDVLKSYSQVDNTPLHVGEVMNLWTMLTATENFLNCEQVTLNKVQDTELKAKMNDLINNYHKPVIEQIKQILLNEGVELPQEPVEKPQIESMDIPPGTKMTDEELANLVVFNLVWAIKFCSRGLVEAIRADVGNLFVQLIIQKSAFAATLKDLMAQKGWLKMPPSYKIPGGSK